MNNKNNKVVNFTLTENQLNKLNDLIKDKNISKSEFFRFIINDEYNKSLNKSNKTILKQ